jgi:hypothetical protein
VPLLRSGHAKFASRLLSFAANAAKAFPKGPFIELLLKQRLLSYSVFFRRKSGLKVMILSKEDVGKMPTLLEDTGGPPMPLFEEAASSSSSFPMANGY